MYRLCEICNVIKVSDKRAKYCNDCRYIAQLKRQDKYQKRVASERAKEREVKLNEYFHTLNLQGLEFLISNFNKKSDIPNTTYTSQFKMNWLEVLDMYGKADELKETLVDEFVSFHNRTNSQSVKLFSETIGSSSRFFKYLDRSMFTDAINPEKRVHSNERLNIVEVKNRIVNYEDDLTIISNEYVNSHTYLTLRCSTCLFEFKRTWLKVVNEQSGCPCCNSNGGKLTFSDVKNSVEPYGYTVLENIGGSRTLGTLFTVRCARNHTYKTSFLEFNRQENQKGGSCKVCISEGFGNSRLAVKDNMLNRLSKLGYTFEGVFNHTQEKMTFECAVGHFRETTMNGIFNSPNCPECNGTPCKLNEHRISRRLKEIGLEYIDGFKDTKENITYRCSCGRVGENKYYNLLNGSRCFECAKQKPWKLEDVRKYFSGYGCELLETEYVNTNKAMKFKCSCGRLGERAFGTFMYSHTCRQCVVDSIPTGSEHHNWDNTLSEENRNYDRNYIDYRLWRDNVYVRDEYTCQCCFAIGGNLNAHHIHGYKEYPELRIVLENGITLCEKCHIDFHMEYGFKGFNELDLHEYIKDSQMDFLNK